MSDYTFGDGDENRYRYGNCSGDCAGIAGACCHCRGQNNGKFPSPYCNATNEQNSDRDNHNSDGCGRGRRCCKCRKNACFRGCSGCGRQYDRGEHQCDHCERHGNDCGCGCAKIHRIEQYDTCGRNDCDCAQNYATDDGFGGNNFGGNNETFGNDYNNCDCNKRCSDCDNGNSCGEHNHYHYCGSENKCGNENRGCLDSRNRNTCGACSYNNGCLCRCLFCLLAARRFR